METDSPYASWIITTNGFFAKNNFKHTILNNNSHGLLVEQKQLQKQLILNF